MLGKITIGIYILLSVAVGSYAQKKSSVSDISKEESAIRQIVKQVEDGWNAHDGKAFAAPFADDADYVVTNGMFSKGKNSIEEGHTRIFSTIYKDSRNAATVKSIRFLRSDVAVVHIEWNLEFRVGSETKKTQAMNTMFMTKENGKWSIAAFHNTYIAPPNQ